MKAPSIGHVADPARSQLTKIHQQLPLAKPAGGLGWRGRDGIGRDGMEWDGSGMKWDEVGRDGTG